MAETTPHERRINTLREALDAAGLAGALLSRPQHMFYFTGVMPGASPSFLLVQPQHILAVAPSPVGQVETITYVDYDIYTGWQVTEAAAQALERALACCGWAGATVGLELAHLPAVFMSVVLGHIRSAADLEDLLWRVRRVKDAGEIAEIETNVAGNDRVFGAVQAAIRPGVSELKVWSVIYQTLADTAGGPISLEADLGAGTRGSYSAAKPGRNQLQAGDTIFVDIYSATHGYYADTTRVFTVGAPNARQQQIHDILVTALAAGEALLHPGVSAKAVDAAVRSVIERAGYGPQFDHDSGHAYGIFQREPPYLMPASTQAVEEGMIMALEPGIYIPGWGGMRLESTYVIESRGARRLDRFPRELITC
jgi:Xaa-Pro aminopeptidase